MAVAAKTSKPVKATETKKPVAAAAKAPATKVTAAQVAAPKAASKTPTTKAETKKAPAPKVTAPKADPAKAEATKTTAKTETPKTSKGPAGKAWIDTAAIRALVARGKKEGGSLDSAEASEALNKALVEAGLNPDDTDEFDDLMQYLATEGISITDLAEDEEIEADDELDVPEGRNEEEDEERENRFAEESVRLTTNDPVQIGRASCRERVCT